MPEHELARDVGLLSAEYPVALLPVRIETRFGARDGRPCLRVRVYPDEIVADSHEPELRPSERDAGETYWRTAWEPAREPEAWRALLVRNAAPRAAWIVRATTPSNLAARPAGSPDFPTVALKAGSWTRPVVGRLLPDRWTVVLYRGGI